MTWVSVYLFLYALLLMLGGVLGYLKAGSVASLVMGLLSGILMAVFTVGTLLRKKAFFWCALGLVLFLALFFGYRYYNSGKWMPGGSLFFISMIGFFFLLFKGYEES